MHIELFENKFIRVAVFDSPTDSNLNFYKDFLESNNISNIVRLCPIDYSEKKFSKCNFFELNYFDGTIPSEEILKEFEKIVKDIYDKDKKISIGIHCRAGFGRSSTLASYLLIKYVKMDSMDSISLIREKIPKSFNSMQLNYLMNLKSETKLKKKFLGFF